MNRAWLVWEEAAGDGRFRQYADLKEDEKAARSLYRIRVDRVLVHTLEGEEFPEEVAS